MNPDAVLPGLLAYHAVLALCTPALLAMAAAAACALLPRPRPLPWLALLPAWALQLVVWTRAGAAADLAGPVATLLRPGCWGATWALILAALLAGIVRPHPAADARPGPPAWRWCLLQACALALPLVPLAALVPAGTWLLAGRSAWRGPAEGALVSALAALLLPFWLLLPAAAPWLVALVAIDCLLALRPGPLLAWPLACLVVGGGQGIFDLLAG